MDQARVTASINGHIEMLNKTFLWSLALAATLVIGELSPKHGSEGIKIIGVDVYKSQAYLLAGFGFIFANLCIALISFRIRDLFTLLSDEELMQGLETVCLTSAFLNPFTDFGYKLRARLHSSLSLGFLILLWWACFISIFLITPFSAVGPLEIIFVVSAGIGIYGFEACFQDLIQRLSCFDQKEADRFSELRAYRITFAIVALLLGAVLNVFLEAFYR